MECQSLFSGKNKKNIINLLSAEFAHGMVSVSKTIKVYKKETENINTLVAQTLPLILEQATSSIGNKLILSYTLHAW